MEIVKKVVPFCAFRKTGSLVLMLSVTSMLCGIVHQCVVTLPHVCSQFEWVCSHVLSLFVPGTHSLCFSLSSPKFI